MSELITPDIIGTVAAALLTIMTLSYILGDNPFFRLAMYLFIGVTAGYAGSITWHNVLTPGLIDPLILQGLAGVFKPNTIVTALVPLLLSLMLLLKVSPDTSSYGGLPLALLVGVGAAVIVGGAITGTLVPQIVTTIDTLDPTAVAPVTGERGLERVFNVVVMLLGTASTLIYFTFSSRRDPSGEISRPYIVERIAYIGRMFIALTFGVMYAGALAATIIVLAGRIQFLKDAILTLLTGL
jgi:hypothetical protein